MMPSNYCVEVEAEQCESLFCARHGGPWANAPWSPRATSHRAPSDAPTTDQSRPIGPKDS